MRAYTFERWTDIQCHRYELVEKLFAPIEKSHTNIGNVECLMVNGNHLSFSDETQNAKSICVSQRLFLTDRYDKRWKWNFSHLYLWLMRAYACLYIIQIRIRDMLYRCVCKWSVHNAYIGQTFRWLYVYCVPMHYVMRSHYKYRIRRCFQRNSSTNFLLAWLWPTAMKKNEHMSIHREVNMSQIREMICVRPLPAQLE